MTFHPGLETALLFGGPEKSPQTQTCTPRPSNDGRVSPVTVTTPSLVAMTIPSFGLIAVIVP